MKELKEKSDKEARPAGTVCSRRGILKGSAALIVGGIAGLAGCAKNEPQAAPPLEASMAKVSTAIDLQAWRQCHCPVCGSPPGLNLLRGEGGKRYSLCSNCGCQWRLDRLSCAICGNREQGRLNYFHAEGEEACRIDLCDRCHHYIKTIDERILETCDPELEDLATPHLDLLAAEKGFTRAAPNPWTGGR